MSSRSVTRPNLTIIIPDAALSALQLESPIRPSLKRRRVSSESLEQHTDRATRQMQAFWPPVSGTSLAGHIEGYPILRSGSMVRARTMEGQQNTSSRAASVEGIAPPKQPLVVRLIGWVKSVFQPKGYQKLG